MVKPLASQISRCRDTLSQVLSVSQLEGVDVGAGAAF
jgi:hypothetical protein